MAPKRALRQNNAAVNASPRLATGIQDKPTFKAQKPATTRRTMTRDSLENIEDPFNSIDTASVRKAQDQSQSFEVSNDSMRVILAELKSLRQTVTSIKPAIPILMKQALDDSDVHNFADEAETRTAKIESSVDDIEEEGAKEETLEKVNKRLERLARHVEMNHQMTYARLTRVEDTVDWIEETLETLLKRPNAQYIGCPIYDYYGRLQGVVNQQPMT